MGIDLIKNEEEVNIRLEITDEMKKIFWKQPNG